MTEDLITFDTAKLAKQKGFKEYTHHGFYYERGVYTEQENEEYNSFVNFNDNTAEDYSRPSQSFLQKWLRTKNIHIDYNYVPSTGLYIFVVKKIIGFEMLTCICVSMTDFSVGLESALLEGLKFIK